MKLKALALGVALAFPMMAQAQSSTSVTLYGVIDTAVEYVNKVWDPVAQENHSSTHMNNLTASVPSRWGLRGTEDLGNGLSAIFTLESGFGPQNGLSGQGDRLFGRQAWVGLKGDWGQVAFGRQYNMLFWANMGGDIMGPNSHGLAAFDNYIPNARIDNSITYRGNFDGFKLGASYSRGRDTSAAGGPAGAGCGVDFTDQSACSSWGAMLGYDAANWGVAAGYDTMKGNNAGNFQGLGPDDKDRRFSVSGYVKFDALKVGLLYINRKTDAVGGINNTAFAGGSLGDRSDIYSLGASYQLSPAVTLDGSVNHLRYKNAADNAKAWYYVARATYSLSKRTAVYASAAFMNNKGDSAHSASSGMQGVLAEPGGNVTSVMAGLRHSF